MGVYIEKIGKLSIQHNLISWIYIFGIVAGIILAPTFVYFDKLVSVLFWIIAFNVGTVLVLFLTSQYLPEKLKDKKRKDIMELEKFIKRSIQVEERGLGSEKENLKILNEREKAYTILKSIKKFSFPKNLLLSIIVSFIYLIFYYAWHINNINVLGANNYILMISFIFSVLLLASIILRLLFFIDWTLR